MYGPICNKIKLPQFLMYVFCSYYKICDLGWGNLTHRVMYIINHVIIDVQKKLYLRFP